MELVDSTLSLAGLLLDAALCISMVVRGRWRAFPALFSFAALDFISNVAFSFIDSSIKSPVYIRAYFFFDIASSAVQLFILFEIARTVLKPAGVWLKGAFRPLALAGLIGGAGALGATLLLQPSGMHGLEANQLRSETFTGLLTCEIVIAMFIAAKQVGLGWRNHVMAVGEGLMFWSLIGTTGVGLAVYFGPKSPIYGAFYYVRSIAYLATVTYWCVSLWRNEPARKPISPALQKYVLALHERVHYDLGKVGH